MIIQPYKPIDGENTHLYIRYRDGKTLIEEHITDFFPYFYVEDDEDEYLHLTTLYSDRFPGWSWGEKKGMTLKDKKGNRKSVRQVFAPNPHSLRKMRELASDSWEGDIVFPDRFAIDTYELGEFPDWYDNMVRAGGLDLEWNEDEEITAMGFTTDGERVHQWSWHPNIEMYDSIILPYSFQFSNEKEMLEHFADFFKDIDPDIITTWSGNRADWPKIYERYKHHDIGFDWLSPIWDKSISSPITHLPRSGSYDEGTQVILGRLTLDLADRNHGFERVWKDSGNGQLSDRRLGEVGKVAFPNNPEWWKVEMDENITHHELWLNHFEKFLEYNRGDVLLTDRLDRQYHVSRFFMALQRVCGVSFGSVFTVSRFARGLIRRKATWIAPTGSYNKGSHTTYPGGLVSEVIPGRHMNVGVFDFAAMYAEIQRADNISPETYVSRGGNNIKSLDNGTHWDQSTTGVLPQLQMDLADARNEAKAEMKKHDPSSTEYAGFNTLQLAFKRSAASVYGLMGHTGHGEASRTVAATITYVGRQLVSRLMEICEEMGYKALAGHTDSAYIGIGDDDGHEIAKALTKRIQDEFDSDRFVVEYEKHMRAWVAAMKNRNFGWTVWPKEGLHCTGFEMKKSNSSQMTKEIQETAFTSMCRDSATEEQITENVLQWIASVRKTVKREALSMRSRLGKNPESYDSAGGFQGAARKYNITNPNDCFVKGDSVPHVYTTKGIEAFRTSSELERLDLDWTTIIQKQIISPVSLIYEAMGWSYPTADGWKPQAWW